MRAGCPAARRRAARAAEGDGEMRCRPRALAEGWKQVLRRHDAPFADQRLDPLARQAVASASALSSRPRIGDIPGDDFVPQLHAMGNARWTIEVTSRGSRSAARCQAAPPRHPREACGILLGRAAIDRAHARRQCPPRARNPFRDRPAGADRRAPRRARAAGRKSSAITTRTPPARPPFRHRPRHGGGRRAHLGDRRAARDVKFWRDGG